jgi:hypothetical protein
MISAAADMTIRRECQWCESWREAEGSEGVRRSGRTGKCVVDPPPLGSPDVGAEQSCDQFKAAKMHDQHGLPSQVNVQPKKR